MTACGAATTLNAAGGSVRGPGPASGIMSDCELPRSGCGFLQLQSTAWSGDLFIVFGEVSRKRPDIPLLVVEGRGTADALGHLPVDLSGLTNLRQMANTPAPRHFYRVSRAVLVPSLWRESLGRVPMEAMAYGTPVLASDRGALPETLGNAGFVFTIPERYTPQSLEVPTARQVAPWVAVLEKLWDDREFEARYRARSILEALRWEPSRIADQFEALLRQLRGRARDGGGKPRGP